jgi:hypothetical protein
MVPQRGVEYKLVKHVIRDDREESTDEVPACGSG